MDKYSYIGNADVAHINNLYESYQEDPESVDASWRLFFQGFEFSANSYGPVPNLLWETQKKRRSKI